MTDNDTASPNQFAQSVAEVIRAAHSVFAAGGAPLAVVTLQAAAVMLAAIEEPKAALIRGRADCCRLLADILVEEDRWPEAMQAYQEAADAYGRLPECEADAQECARRIVQGVRELRRRPAERLNLLVARYDRDLRQLAAREGTALDRAEMLFRLATLLQRRDRFQEARDRYAAAVELLEGEEGAELRLAMCHFRLAGLYHHELPSAPLAQKHYQEAIRLFALFEPITDGEQPNRVVCEMLLRGLGGPPTA